MQGEATEEGGGTGTVMEDFATDNTENRFAVDLVFVKLLLPALRIHVTERMEAFYEDNPALKKPGGYRDFLTDPIKKNVDLSHPIVMYGNGDLLPNFHAFAKLYFEKPFFDNLLTCGDIRIFLVLVTKAGIFSGIQANLAYKLKNLRDALAHQEVISDKMKLEVFDHVEQLLETIPDSENYIKGMKQARENVRSFLRTTPKLYRKTPKRCSKAVQMSPEYVFEVNEKFKKQMNINSHLLVAFTVNVFCLALSIANIAACNADSTPQIKELEWKSSEVVEKHGSKQATKKEHKAVKRREEKPTNDKASNTWITTMAKRRPSQESKRPTIVIKTEEKKSPKKTNTSSAVQAGYYFNCWDPTPDPRFHPDTQLMIGPIPSKPNSPCHLLVNVQMNFVLFSHHNDFA